MTTIVYTKSYSSPPLDKREALRYSGVSGETKEIEEIFNICVKECTDILSYKLCYCEFPLTRVENTLDFGFSKVNSKSLAKHLYGCDRVIVFAATVGLEIDRLISKYSKLKPTMALIMQGIGAERVEALCDLFYHEQTIEKAQHGMALTSRFSSGYGDFPLEFQRDIFKILDCPRKIGLTLNERLIMSPTKSVTAIIGIKSKTCEIGIAN